MNALTNFGFEDHLVRVIELDGEPWFVGKDVCRCLELGNPRSSLALLGEDERGVHTVDTPSAKQEMVIINEFGLYRLIFQSRKPAAERFKRWLAHEVLPSIRKTGSYTASDAPQAEQASSFATSGPELNHLQDIATKARLVELTLKLSGRQSARGLWRDLGLPVANGFYDEGPAGGVVEQLMPHVQAFIEEACEIGRDEVRAQVLFEAYCRYSAGRGEEAASQTAFGLICGVLAMKMGFVKLKRRLITYRGLTLKQGQEGR
ncbi:BRO-N domain-containing protein [Polycladidibacter hongkongensis]|uniref:BRO-N domain-containing protein n=1 Tax=Polycladidibacter hongkongensis TaxID=1647556 RepID=UPI00082F5989|nr:BRO family protein [Pseudovibrio hongkongensis]